MPEDTTQDGKSQTAGSEGADQKEETYTKAQLSEMISKEVGKVTAKHSKKYDDLKAELEVERRKSLPDPEKVKAELADKDKAISEKDKELFGVKLENAKLRALAKVGADPEKIDSLMKRVVGSTPEEIEADVLELKSLGLIGPREANGAQGAGNPGIPKPKAEPTLQEELEAEQAKGAGADPLKLIQIRSLISAGAKKK